jgi:hypothetical protein
MDEQAFRRQTQADDPARSSEVKALAARQALPPASGKHRI